MELNYEIFQNDIVQYNIFHLEHSKRYKRMWLTLGIIAPIVVVLINFMSAKQFDLIFNAIFVILWFGLWLGFGKKILKIIITKDVNRFMHEGKRNEFIGKKRLVLSDDMIFMQDTSSTTEVLYESVERIERDNERLYIYIGSITAIIVPFSAFSSIQEQEAFCNYIKQRATL